MCSFTHAVVHYIEGLRKIMQPSIRRLRSYDGSDGRLSSGQITIRASKAFRKFRQPSGMSLFSYVGSVLCVLLHIKIGSRLVMGAFVIWFRISVHMFLCSFAGKRVSLPVQYLQNLSSLPIRVLYPGRYLHVAGTSTNRGQLESYRWFRYA